MNAMAIDNEAPTMERFRIMLMSEDHFVFLSLSAMIQNIGHTVNSCDQNAQKTVAGARDVSPDFIITDMNMEERGGFDKVLKMLEQHTVPIVLMTDAIRPELIERADTAGVAGYLIKPISQKDIQPALALARSRFKQIQALKQEIAELKNMLRSRKLVEQAKGLLMERECIPEAEAFRRIQRLSRDRNIPMAAISEAIIMSEKLTHRSKDKVYRFRAYERAAQEQPQD